jgi:hypothetical protein
MHTIAPVGTGTACDRLNAITIALRGCIDRRALEHRFPAIGRALEGLAPRVRRSGCTGPTAEAVRWLQETIEQHPVLSEPAAAGLRHELRTLAERIGR